MFNKLLLGACVIALLFSFYACNDDDWAPYYSSTERLEIIIEPENTMRGISDNIQQTLKELSSDFSLTDIVLTLTINDTEEDSPHVENILFTYVKTQNEKENKVTKFEVSYSMNESMVYQTSFESGHGRRVSATVEPIGEKYITLPINGVLEQITSLEEYRLLINMGMTEIGVYFNFDRFIFPPGYFAN